ncbi:hypothetical protein H4P12_11740 [Paracoccus sp. 11-3]|uniref:Chaperone modulatory protein CbpM n=1 Tax=Paracoccus amoyensis TaxID=2760093 RepID=A0A926GF17_9RHOB|nr:hypothetical protein [Paracoccus amoyensis]MBC9247366.1 hypothetical protein [Paracoccus amoyensis]
MTRFYSETEVISRVDDLTQPRLGAFIRARIISPVTTPQGPAYRETDLARLQLLVDLAEAYELPDDSLTMVMSLIDQLNTARGDMRALMQAVAAEPDDVRGRITTTVRHIRIVHIDDDPENS